MSSWPRYAQSLRRFHYRPLLIPFFFVAGTTVFINDHVVELISITGPSMAPTLSPDYHETGKEDWVLLRKWYPTRDLKRGDIIQFGNPNKPEEMAIKRVIALEGDTVLLDKRRRPEGRTGPNGRENAPDALGWDAWNGKAKVPPGHMWVEGDNCARSKDSNYYGPISKSLIGGKAIAIFWPPTRFATRPWEGYRSRTKVIEGKDVKDWTEGLPIELAEIAEPHMPP